MTSTKHHAANDRTTDNGKGSVQHGTTHVRQRECNRAASINGNGMVKATATATATTSSKGESDQCVMRVITETAAFGSTGELVKR